MQVLFPITHDGTLIDDGWLVGSGTSSATPMVAGVAALLIEKERKKPGGGATGPELVGKVKATLMETARDITIGMSANGHYAHGGVDLATGAGVVDAEAAVGIRFRIGVRIGNPLDHLMYTSHPLSWP